MILNRLSLWDFGIYNGRHDFDLQPTRTPQFEQPITIFRGKNGVGKSTIMEAMRLAFHGSLILGNRVSRSAYLQYLASRIHRHDDPLVTATEAGVEVEFEYVVAGKSSICVVTRHWRRTGERILESVELLEDGKSTKNLAQDAIEALLRELLPPSAADVFFFDSERLYALSDDEAGRQVLGDNVRALLGITIVDRLSVDLDVFLSRNVEAGVDRINDEIASARNRQVDLGTQRETLAGEVQQHQAEIASTLEAIHKLESQIAGEGNAFSLRREDLRQSQNRLWIEIERQRSLIQDMTSGLLPFAIAPSLCQRMAQRLIAEQETEHRIIAEKLVEQRLANLRGVIDTEDFWSDLGIKASSKVKIAFAEKVKGLLSGQSEDLTNVEHTLVFRVSDQERRILQHWVDDALNVVPKQFSSEAERLRDYEAELRDVERELALIPADEVIKPLMASLAEMHQALAVLRQREKAYADQMRMLDYDLERTSFTLRNLHQNLTRATSIDRSVRLAAQTQMVLTEYREEVLREKLSVLGEAVKNKFNELCRKEGFVDIIAIDPASFQITLQRAGMSFSRNELSAGEKQLLATATMWALREVSGLPIPVIIDTPVGRLDTEHRRRMIADYFPRASHQVLLLATDAELSDSDLDVLSDSISHVYELGTDPATDEVDEVLDMEPIAIYQHTEVNVG